MLRILSGLVVGFVLSVPVLAEENVTPAPPAQPPVLGAQPALPAAPPAAPNPLAGWETKLQKSVTFDFKDMDVSEVLAFLQQVSGLNITMTAEARDEAEDMKVNLKLDDVPVINALEAVTRSVGLILEPQPPIMYVTAKSDDVIGQLEITTDNVTVTLDLTAQDLPSNLRRELVERSLRNARQEAELSTRRKMMENLPPEAREKMKKAMENQFGGEKPRKKGEKGEKPAEEKVPPEAVAPQVF